VALVAGAVLLVMVRPTGMDAFFHRIESPPAGLGPAAGDGASAPRPPATDAVIAIRVDLETDVSTIDLTPPPPPPPVPEAPPREQPREVADEEGPSRADLDVGDVLERAGVPRTGGSASSGGAVPPRPIEITWPETRRLKHCIGRSFEVRVLVGEDGLVQRVEAAAQTVEADCQEAALEAARRIKFEPGRVGGVASTVWTQVRIDFERKR
jgi:TonB family protein